MRNFFLVLSFLLPAFCYAQYIYISTDKNEIYRVDLSGTCTSTYFSVCTGSTSDITDIAVDSQGKLYICRNDSIFLLDTNNPGAGCVFVTSFGSYKIKAMEIGPDGRLYAIDRFLLRYDFVTGQLVNLGELPAEITGAGDLVFYVNGLFLSTTTGSIYEIDINAPGRSKPYYDPHIYNLVRFLVGPVRCVNSTSDELRFFAFENSTANGSIVNIIDMEKKITYNNYCSLNEVIRGISGFHPPTIVTGHINSFSVLVIPASCNKTADGRMEVHMADLPAPESYTFSLDNGPANTTGVFNNLRTGNYVLTIHGSIDCSRDTSVSVTALAADCKDGLYVPSAFTPDGDGNNDIFRVRSFIPFADFQMQLFNRNGFRVYQSQSISSGWDGTFHNVPQNTGVYIWQIRYRNLDGQTVYRKGLVTLIR